MDFKPITRQNTIPKQQEVKEGLLLVRSANQCIENAMRQAIPRKLCGELWFEGEVCILFADTNVGKSILAVQIADNISRGIREGVFHSEAPAQYILYLDFELSDKQFEKRYSLEWEHHYQWDNHFLRVQINANFSDFIEFEKQLFAEIEASIEQYGSKILIVDNITFLSMESNESSKNALPLMKYLTKLKNQFGLSLLVLAHTPKRLNPSNPLSINDLAGSRQLANFADSVFCIGRSNQGTSIRYIKQLKARSCAMMEEVWVCELSKSYNFLGFEFLNVDYEHKHLKPKKEADEEMKTMISTLKAENPDVSMDTMAETLGTYKMKIKRLIDKHNL
jgi:predicted ATP-dependent serine protease